MQEYPNINLYNTKTRQVEAFEPMSPGNVKIYCCGPTVYNYQHIGNLRTYIFEDILTRTLRYAGYEVEHVMNITDVGHLVSDADEGEDKMLLASKREGKSSYEISNFYTDIFFKHCAMLNIVKPNIICKATEHIEHMIQIIQTLFDKGYAYLNGGNVYFDVQKFPRYGDLALLDLQKLKAGARIDVDDNKRSAFDFVLWFTKSKFENQELLWDSPWGKGYPGWHIECSAMAMHYLGDKLDIHCGGIDHIPVHHTNEIAQSECASGAQFANFWVHGGWLTCDKEKMSKSSGGFLTLDKLMEQGIDPLAYRYMCLTAIYRRELSWSQEGIESAANSYRKIKSGIQNVKEGINSLSASITAEKEADSGSILSPSASQFKTAFEHAVYSDLNMPKALAVVHGIFESQDLTNVEKRNLLLRFDSILGLGIEQMFIQEESIPPEVISLNEQRNTARAEKRWKEADELRDRISELGFVVVDSKDGGHIKARVS